MAKSKYENIWQILSKNDFKDQVPQEFHCVICKNVAIEPYGSLCGCRFCSLCIREYLKDGIKRCPGGGSICFEEILKIDVNIARDFIITSKIGLLVVKCIHEMCEVRCKLEMMDDHLRVCDMSPTKCPYERIGCQVTDMSRDNIKCHDNEWLVEAIDTLKNEVNGLKNIMEIKDEQFNENYERDKIIIVEMKHKIDQQRTDIDEQRNEIDMLKDDNGIKNSEMKIMKEDLKMKEMTILELKQEINQQRTKIDSMKNDNEKILRDVEVMKEYLKIENETQSTEMKEEVDKVKKDIEEMGVRGEVGDQNKSLNDLKESHESIVREMASVNVNVKDCQIYDESEFLWRVDKISEVREHHRERKVIVWRYSVKFELCLRWSVKSDLNFKCRILTGKFDDGLPWPMEHKITLSVINQASKETHRQREYSRDFPGVNKAAFDKPKDGENNYFIFDEIFMTAAEVRDSPEVILNDSLIGYFKVKR